ncbi:MAG TPA: cation:proton antiporter [Bacteroidales bacterium]|nr:cation:proton antiporter [Bacteroidales bacterium]HPS73460.1 cation:proton antiporter [Bacteroidales bacterium]
MLHLPALITDLALILTSAALVTLLFKKLKQPVVLGYIIAGLLVGPKIHLFPTVIEVQSIQTWADIGVIFLLFGLGLEFSFKKLLKVGGVAALTAITEVGLTLLLGYGVGRLLGWSSMDSLFLGGILSIASTTIIIRAFDELGVKNQKFAGIVTGVLVIEDLVAVLLMVLLSTVSVSRTFEGTEMLKVVVELAFFIVLWFVSGIFFIPTFFRKFRLLINGETLLIISLAFCFLMVVLATYVGFSSALGAFIMGSILAETTKAEKIEQLTRSVKSLFGAIFFVSVGMLIDPQMLGKHLIPIIAGILVLLFGKPLFVTLGVLISGQPLKIAVQSGMSLSQIGEFSFIIATLGLSLHVTSDFLYPVAVAVSVITTFTSPYMIRFSEPFYTFIEKVLPQKWKNGLASYSASAQHMTETTDWKKVIRSYVVNVVIFSVIIMTLIVFSTRFIEPILSNLGLHKVITAIITLTVLSPFLWALAFRRTQRQAFTNIWLKTSHRGPLLLLQFSRVIFAVIFIGVFFLQLFSPLIAVAGIIFSCLIIALFHKRIQHFYSKIETRFMINYNERQAGDVHVHEMLTPWDTHITKFELESSFPYIGQTLMESRLRESFGVNIVMIERGDQAIHVPSRKEHLYPFDRISVIGTDEQLERFEKFMEKSAAPSNDNRAHKEVSLHHFTISEHSSLIGKSIRQSGIRELSQGLVVGIERNGERIVNPESNVVFHANDTVWIVGDERRIRIIIKESTSNGNYLLTT